MEGKDQENGEQRRGVVGREEVKGKTSLTQRVHRTVHKNSVPG